MTKENLEKMIDGLFLKSAVKDCFDNLQKEKDADAFETQAGHLCSLDEKEEYQVKVIVTRKEDDFLGAFDNVKHSTFKA